MFDPLYSIAFDVLILISRAHQASIISFFLKLNDLEKLKRKKDEYIIKSMIFVSTIKITFTYKGT